MIDAVLGYHTNKYTCGVAKFNERLARELGVPHEQIAMFRGARHPLVSVKFQELIDNGATNGHFPWPAFDLFAHDVPTQGVRSFDALVTRAETVYAGNEEVASMLRGLYKRDIVTAWCPSTVAGNPSRGAINILTFGMAHKLTRPYYQKLKDLLDDTAQSYTVSLSCAVHEGNPWDVAMREAEVGLRAVFGSQLRVLGYLADDALVREIDMATAVAAFYDPALRANNTSAWAVLERGCPLVTNLDQHSPVVPGVWSIDRDTWTQFPRCSPEAAVEALAPYSWPRLARMFEHEPCVK